MASKTLIPVEEYLKMRFDGPEPDYVDGELIERHLGSKPHSKAQVRLIVCFEALKKSCPLEVYSEITLRISPTRYRVADLAVVMGQDTDDENYPARPPEFVVEIVSEDDRHVDIQTKLSEYQTWGVKHIWLVDPWTRKLHVCDHAGLHEVVALEATEFGVRFSAGDIFVD
jgi:Uma2 family endonuclease